MKVLFSVLLILVAISAGCLYNTPYVMASQCNDGIDNDDDGLIDANNSGGDSECAYVDRPSGDPSTWTFYICPSWNSETVPPMSLNECLGV